MHTKTQELNLVPLTLFQISVREPRYTDKVAFYHHYLWTFTSNVICILELRGNWETLLIAHQVPQSLL